MNLLSIALIGISLAMDAFAVSVTNGMAMKKVKVKEALRIAICFGIFQGIMPFLGWLIGTSFKDYITTIDHWIAFILLGVLGGKMIYESLKGDEEDEVKELTLKVLILLAIATSIDALAVGITFAFLQVAVLEACILIACITFFICFAGVFLGNLCGGLFKNKAEIFGGAILIIIGFKILAEHMQLADVVLNFIR